MANSLQEQLIKAGLADQLTAAKEKRSSSASKPRSARPPVKKKSVRKPTSAKVVKNPELERERRELRAMEQQRKHQEKQAQEQARATQRRKDKVRKFLLEHQQNDAAGEIAFHFQANNRIRRVYVTVSQRTSLLAAELLLVVMGKRDFLVARELRDAVIAIDPDLFIFDASIQQECEPAEDDPYKAFVVPDDLMW